MADSSAFPSENLTVLVLNTYPYLPLRISPKIFLNGAQPVRILNMKGTKLIVLILSILLLTISSGLLFYKNLFMLESPGNGARVDFEELRYVDMQINAITAISRNNLTTDSSELNAEIIRIKELLNIITDIKKNDRELNNSAQKIQSYFDEKIQDLNKFQVSLEELKFSVNSINADYNELNKNNIKFTVDKRDFYRECVVDALFYVSLSNKDNENRLVEDKKILGQILNFASTPNPHIQKFANHIDIIHRRTGELDYLINKFNSKAAIEKDMNTVGEYYRESQISNANDGQIFLTIIFGAIVLYMASLVIILKKLG